MYKLELYRQMFNALKMGRNASGQKSNAKPIFILSLIDFVPFSKQNLFEVSNHLLLEYYNQNFMFYDKPNYTQMIYPFFHMHREPFYSICWKNDNNIPKIKHSPSAKFLREHTYGAQLDAELWELLQEEENRAYLRQCIINTYLTK